MTICPRVPLVAAALAVLAAAAPAQLLFGPSKISTFSPSTIGLRLDAGDVNGDGFPDLVSTVGGTLTLSLGNGAGNFGFGTAVAAGVSGSEVCLARLDGDSFPDLLVVSHSFTTLYVALADGAGDFEAPAAFTLGPGGTNGRFITTGDADSDGDLDVVATTRGIGAGPYGEARLLVNDGNGVLTLGAVVSGDASSVVDVGIPRALDAHAEPDLLVSTANAGVTTTTAWLGQPGGGVTDAWSASGAPLRAAEDLDGDGDQDFVAATLSFIGPFTVSTYLGNGDGTFAAGPTTDLGSFLFTSATLKLQSFDADGLPDLFVAHSGTPDAWMLRGDGAGGFETLGARVSLMPGVVGLGTTAGPCADFDADGRLDVSAYLHPAFQTQLAVAFNETYPEGGPLLDLGHQLGSGVTGYPIQIAEGTFAGGSPFSFKLFNGPASGAVFHVVGLSTLFAPFKGGTLVPSVNLITGPWPTTSSGALAIAGHWPNGAPSGLKVFAQFWFAAPSTVAGFAASSGVQITTP